MQRRNRKGGFSPISGTYKSIKQALPFSILAPHMAPLIFTGLMAKNVLGSGRKRKGGKRKKRA